MCQGYKRKCIRRIIILILVVLLLMTTSYETVSAKNEKFIDSPNLSINDKFQIEQILLKTPDSTFQSIHQEELSSDIKEDTGLLDEFIGDDRIDIENFTLVRYELPQKYYPKMNHSYFQPFMSWKCITKKNSGSYQIVNSSKAYIDENGFRRYATDDNQFTIEGEDDFIIALGNFYKKRGEVGGRYLVVTSTGMYTAITGGEKSNWHTDNRNMFSIHGSHNQYAGVIEWIVDPRALPEEIKQSGTVTTGPIEELQGTLLYIYRIH